LYINNFLLEEITFVVHIIVVLMLYQQITGDKVRFYLYFLLGLHGKLLGIDIIPRSKINWAFIFSAYVIGLIWLLQSNLPFLIKVILILVASYKFIRTINS